MLIEMNGAIFLEHKSTCIKVFVDPSFALHQFCLSSYYAEDFFKVVKYLSLLPSRYG